MSNPYNDLTEEENKSLAKKCGWYKNPIDGNNAFSLKDDGDKPEYYYYDSWAELVYYQDLDEDEIMWYIH